MVAAEAAGNAPGTRSASITCAVSRTATERNAARTDVEETADCARKDTVAKKECAKLPKDVRFS